MKGSLQDETNNHKHLTGHHHHHHHHNLYIPMLKMPGKQEYDERGWSSRSLSKSKLSVKTDTTNITLQSLTRRCLSP